MKTANSIESRLKPILEENICLSSQSNKLQEEISALKGRYNWGMNLELIS